MREVKAILPKPEADYFLYVDKAPTKNKIDIPERKEHFLLNIGTHKVKCQLEGYLEYKMNGPWSSLLCKLSYGLSTDDLKAHIRRTLKITSPDATIAFYICRILDKQEIITPTHHLKLGLPNL